MASSFGWKRKHTHDLSDQASPFFNGGNSEDEQDERLDPLHGVKRAAMLEDNETTSKRLQQQGITLAENERYWEALKYWNEALELTPNSAVLHEMKSQVLLEVGEVFPAVQSAESAVLLESTWSIARQSLGRAQLGIGELEMALANFKKALHIDPSNTEIRDEDIPHTISLLKQRDETLNDQ